MNQRPAIDRSTTEADRIGFFGKLPTHGDFVAAGLNRATQDALDAWLQSGLAKAQQQVGDRWEHIFRAMPVWRFVMERGIWGPAFIAGVIAPSRDRVGRSFPLVIAAQLHDFADDPRKLCLDDTWFTALEGIAETAGRRDFAIDGFTANLKRLRTLRAGDRDFPSDPSAKEKGPLTLWWRLDQDDRRIKSFHVNRPPQPSDFLDLMMAGAREAPKEQPARVTAPSTPSRPVQNAASKQQPAAGQPVERRHFRLDHGQASHAGTRLAANADAVLVRDRPFLFAVADGTGDGTDAVEASRATIAMLADSGDHEAIDSLVQEVKGKLGRAHGLLQAAGIQDRTPPSASLVTLAIARDRYAVVWAGDSSTLR